MTISDAQGWIMIIGTLTTSIVAIIAAVKVNRVQKQGAVIETKVDTVHELTNSRLSQIEGELAATRAELAASRAGARTAEEARVVLASEAARTVERHEPQEPQR